MRYVHDCAYCGWRRTSDSPTMLAPRCELRQSHPQRRIGPLVIPVPSPNSFFARRCDERAQARRSVLHWHVDVDLASRSGDAPRVERRHPHAQPDHLWAR